MAEGRKSERRNSKEFLVPPLDEITLEVKNKQGKLKNVPALHIGFSENRLFIPYKPPPLWTSPDSKQQGEKGPPGLGKLAEFAEATLEEWLQLTSYLIEDLHWLLKLPHHRFWSQVAYDDNVHGCIHSYLQNGPRYYDLNNYYQNDDSTPNWKLVYATWQKVHRLIFMIFLRMSTYKESKKAHISPHSFGELIYQNYIFDIPTLMSLCVLYGKENRALLSKMINNIFTVQPSYYEDLSLNIEGFFQVFDMIEDKLALKNKIKMENLFELHSPIQRERKHKLPSNLEFKDIQELVSVTADTLITISAFIDIFPSGCQTFHIHNFELRIALFYESVFHIFIDYMKDNESELKLSKISKKLLRLIGHAKAAVLKMFHDIIFSSCLEPILEMNSKGEEYVESFLQIMSTCLNEKSFICDYETNYPFEEDLDMISQTQTELDETRTSFIQNSIYSIMGKSDPKEPSLCFSTIKDGETKHLDKFFQETSEYSNIEGATASNVNAIELESLMFSVLDVFPNLGKGFIEACLEYYNFEYEKVISALLDDSLPSSLNSLDRNASMYDPSPSVRPKDKSSLCKNKPTFSNLISERKNIYDGDEFDVFSRDDVDRSKIHKGKKMEHQNISSLLDDKKDVQAVKESYKKYEVTVSKTVSEDFSDFALPYDYEDEYDDTYDDTTTSAWSDDRQPGDDIELGRKFTIPRVLRTKDYEDEEEDEQDEEIPTNPNHILADHQNPTSSEQASSSHSKQGTSSEYNQRSHSKASSSKSVSNSRYYQEGNSRKFTSRNENGPNLAASVNGETPSAILNTREFRPKKEYANVKGKPKGQGQDDKTLNARKSKEQHKGAYANHNRKAQSDRKRNRGMIPT